MPDQPSLLDLQVHDYLDHAFGAARLQKISEALARPALHTCLRVNTLRTTPQVLLLIVTYYI
jgi:16S rRNA C967 or C1407 C5-methylase (RsmB/RsmF family)